MEEAVSDKSKIEWTEATWNPVTGCTKVSPGCDHCYAETFAERWRGIPGHAYERGFDLTLRPARLDQPLRWTRPRRVFVNSMSDLFQDGVPDEFVAKVFGVMAAAPQHTFQVLTKRHGRMRSLLQRDEFREAVFLSNNRDQGDVLGDRWPLPNVWLGVSVEDQKWANIRVPALLDTPAAVRWLSCEPLLGPVDLTWCDGVNALERDWIGGPGGGSGAPHPFVDWVVVGGESGAGARPMDPTWARRLRDDCTAASVPFFFKQWGGRSAKAAGRELDGRTWDEYPEAS
jgi:protein gp37